MQDKSRILREDDFVEGISLVFTILFFLGSLVSIIWGVYIIRLNSKSSINRVFLLLCVALAIWSLGFAMSNSTENLSDSVFWRRFASIGMTSIFAFILHYLILLTRQDEKKEPSRALYLLYIPSLICMCAFSFSAEIAAVQYDLVQTSYGLTNVAPNSNWNYFYYIYYASYMILSLIIIWDWRRRLEEENIRQANIILLAMLATSIFGSLTDIIAATFMSDTLPQMAPLFILMPVWAMYYSARHYGLMNLGETLDGEMIASEEDRKNIFKNISLGFYMGAVLAFSFQYIPHINQSDSFENTLLKSLLLAGTGVLINLIQKIKKESIRENITILVLVFSIPLITLQYLEYASITIWAYPMVIIISSIIFSKLNLLILSTGISIITQVAIWIINPEMTVVVDKFDYILRIIMFILVFTIGLYINRMYLAKIKENKYQIHFQEMASDISYRFVSLTPENFDEQVDYLLDKIGLFFAVDRASLLMVNPDKDTTIYSNSWSENEIGKDIKIREKLALDKFSWFMDQLNKKNLVLIEDSDFMPEEASLEQEELHKNKVKSSLALAVNIKGEMQAFIVMDSISSKKQWTEEDIDLIKIMGNILSSGISQLEADMEIELMAYYDNLTKLPNRFLFEDKVNKAISQSEKTGKPIAIMFIDLDNFKVVNDTIGHKGGDELLSRVARDLANCIRESDAVARFGGDEFMIMINKIADPSIIDLIAERVMEIFSDVFTIDGQEFLVTASAGVAMYPRDGEDPETLIKNADIAMYEAKVNGKNQYALCSEEIKSELKRNTELSNELYQALEKDEFVVHYQPQINLTTSKIEGIEALIRWNHPKRGMIASGEFIGLAEDNGLINDIGEWVLKTACRQNKKWQDMGLPHLKMAVNLSAIQIIDPNIAEKIKNIIQETKLNPKYIELELTESVAIQESDYVIDVLNKLKEIGVSIAIDDFGTEYSSLSRLKDLPIDRIKIDMQFIHGIENNEKDKAITMVIINLAKNLGLNVLAEGVETESQLQFLNEKMCEYAQGFYYYKPMSAEKMERILKDSESSIKRMLQEGETL